MIMELLQTQMLVYISLFLEILSHLNIPPPLKCCRMFLPIILIKSALRISSHGVGSAAIYVCSWAFVRKCIQMGLFLKLCMCMCIHIWLLTLYHGARYQGWHLLGSIEACSDISRVMGFRGAARFLENTVYMYMSNFNNPTQSKHYYAKSSVRL